MRVSIFGARSTLALATVASLLSWSLLAGDPMPDGPSVQGLLELCNRGAANGGKGVEAAGCEWFAVPCACKLRDAPGGGAGWCVPEHVTIDEQVRRVIAELRRLPDKTRPAQAAVVAILARLYPCSGDLVSGSD